MCHSYIAPNSQVVKIIHHICGVIYKWNVTHARLWQSEALTLLVPLPDTGNTILLNSNLLNKWPSCSRCAIKAMHTHLGVIPKMTRELLLRGNSDTEWLVRWTGSWTNTSVASRFQWKFYVDGRLSRESTSPFTTALWCKVLISCCFKIIQKKLLNKRRSCSRFTMNVVYSYFGGDTKNDQRIAPTEGQWFRTLMLFMLLAWTNY